MLSKIQLKRTAVFHIVYRRGRWAHARDISLGVHPNETDATRIGLRTRRGLKGAVVRNKLKRQLRHIVYAQDLHILPGQDLVIVIHPRSLLPTSAQLRRQLIAVCAKLRILSQRDSSSR